MRFKINDGDRNPVTIEVEVIGDTIAVEARWNDPPQSDLQQGPPIALFNREEALLLAQAIFNAAMKVTP